MSSLRRYGLALLCGITGLCGAWLATTAAEKRRNPGILLSNSACLSRVIAPFASSSTLALPGPLPPKPVIVALTGDVSISLGVSQILANQRPPQFPFGDVADRLRAYDLLVGNLECVISTLGQPAIREPLVAPPETPQLLLEAGFDLVSIANNHTLDLSGAGYFDMLAKLDAAGIAHFGSTTADSMRDPIIVRDVQGIRVALIGHMNREETLALEDIARARTKADVVIVFEHWGIEYARVPIRHQRMLGRTLIDAGADAVVGAHAHVVQPIEIYKNRLIAYGLGNFVFSSMVRQGTHTGAVLELEVNKRGIATHRFRSVHIDAQGAPHWHGEPAPEPELDPPGPRPLGPL